MLNRAEAAGLVKKTPEGFVFVGKGLSVEYRDLVQTLHTMICCKHHDVGEPDACGFYDEERLDVCWAKPFHQKWCEMADYFMGTNGVAPDNSAGIRDLADISELVFPVRPTLLLITAMRVLQDRALMSTCAALIEKMNK